MAAIDEFVSGLEEIEPEIPQAFTWNGAQYPCFANGATKGGKLELYGFGVSQDLVIIVRAELFPDVRPEKEQIIQFNGVDLRIDHVLTAPNDSFLRLACVNASRGS